MRQINHNNNNNKEKIYNKWMIKNKINKKNNK